MNEPASTSVETLPVDFRLGDFVRAGLALLRTLWPATGRPATDIDWEDGEPEPAFDRPA